MPRYSPTRKVFTSVSKDIKDLPFDEVFELYMSAYSQVKSDAQALADDLYNFRLQELEDMHSSNNPEEGSFEGNFTDVITKAPPIITSAALNKATTLAINQGFIEKYGIAIHSEWILPQVVTLLGSMPLYKNSNGLYSGKQFKYNNFNTNWLKGVLTLTMLNTKSSYLKLQYKNPSKSFGALVPLVMYAQRLNKGIPYSAWDPEEIHHIIHSELVNAMLCRELPIFTREDLISYRKEGLTVKSGATVGTLKNPITTHALSGVSDPMFKQLPSLVQVMLAQIWMAHPENRTKYMVLDPTNWDKMPSPLVSDDVLLKTPDLSVECIGVSIW